MTKNKILICTFLALSSGFFGAYSSAQITTMLHNQKCQNQYWGLKIICNTGATLGGMWQGSTTGLWTGTVLGTFVGGLVTRETHN